MNGPTSGELCRIRVCTEDSSGFFFPSNFVISDHGSPVSLSSGFGCSVLGPLMVSAFSSISFLSIFLSFYLVFIGWTSCS